MADITMCLDQDCPKCQNCYRFCAPSDGEDQTYFMGSPRQGAICDFYWPLETETD